MNKLSKWLKKKIRLKNMYLYKTVSYIKQK